VGDGLSGGIDGPHESTAQHHCVQPHLQQLKQAHTGVSGQLRGLGEGVLHLPFADIVLRPQPLLLDQLLLVATDLPLRCGTMLPRRIGTVFHHLGCLRGERNAQLAGKLHLWSPTVHNLSPVP
jgi:hypothetical protein